MHRLKTGGDLRGKDSVAERRGFLQVGAVFERYGSKCLKAIRPPKKEPSRLLQRSPKLLTGREVFLNDALTLNSSEALPGIFATWRDAKNYISY